MPQDNERVTSASTYDPTNVSTPEAAALTEFEWPPQPGLWSGESRFVQAENTTTDAFTAPAAQADKPFAHGAGVSTPSFTAEAIAPVERAGRSYSGAAPETTVALGTKGERVFHLGPAWFAILGAIVVLQGAFILKTQFIPSAESGGPGRAGATESLARPGLTAGQPVLAVAIEARAAETRPAASRINPPPPTSSPTATKQAMGRLIVRSDPPGAKVLLDGRSQGVTPVNLAGVAPGARRLSLYYEGHQIQQVVQVEAGSTASVIVPLTSTTERSASGKVAIVAPWEIDIFEGEVLVGTSRAPELILLAGPHTLRFVNEAFGYQHTQQVVVEAGKRISVPVQAPQSELNVNALPWAEVSLDGDKIGETPIGNLKVGVGPHVVTFHHPELGERTIPVAVKVGIPARVTVDMRK